MAIHKITPEHWDFIKKAERLPEAGRRDPETDTYILPSEEYCPEDDEWVAEIEKDIVEKELKRFMLSGTILMLETANQALYPEVKEEDIHDLFDRYLEFHKESTRFWYHVLGGRKPMFDFELDSDMRREGVVRNGYMLMFKRDNRYFDSVRRPTREEKKKMQMAKYIHINDDPNTWEHWIYQSYFGPVPMEMPEENVRVMVASWAARMFEHNDTKYLKKWYCVYAGRIVLHYRTRVLVEQMIDQIMKTIEFIILQRKSKQKQQ